MKTMWDFMDQRQLTVYDSSDDQMKMKESPGGELIFVTLEHKDSHQLCLLNV